jgi:hypothetical protein
MTIRRGNGIVKDHDGIHHVSFFDVIEYKGQFWIVPEWLVNTSQGVQRPARIVSLATRRHSRSRGNPEFVVDDPIPISVFEGRTESPEASGFVVQEMPDIEFPIPPAVH